MASAGVTLGDRYTLQRVLGRGAMGEVWLGRDPVLGREVAVKVMLAVSGAESVRRFQREAAILAGLQHPGITVVHDAGRHEAYHFIVMELLHGHDLAQLLAQNPEGLPFPRVLDLTSQTVDALAVAHHHGVIHRDLKPANLFVQASDRVKVCDFGIARSADMSEVVTSTGLVIGTPAYMSPEQWQGQEADARSDLYALGVVMFELLTGRHPFPASQPLYSLMRQHVEQVPPRLSTLRYGIPRELEDLVMGLLSKEPGHRPDAQVLATALAALATQDSAPTRPVDLVDFVQVPRHDRRPTSPAPTVPPTRVMPGPTGPACTLLRTLKGQSDRGCVDAMGFSPDGRALAASYSRSGVHIWDPHTGEQLRLVAGRTDRIYSLAFSLDGRTLATGGDDKVIRLWDPHTDALRGQLTGHTGTVDSVVFSPDGRILAIGTYSEARLSDAHTGKGLTSLSGATGPVAFSPDGDTLATGDAEGRVCIWDPRTGRRLRRRLKIGHTAHISSLAFSPDGRTIAAVGNTFAEDGEVLVHVWDAHTGKRHRRFTGHTDNICSLAFSPDGRVLAAGDNSGTVIVRDAHTGEQLLILTRQSERVRAVAFSPDGDTLAVGCLDGSVRLWAIRTGVATR
ncbi:WD40 repeat domain-containing serine/threonine protein kinase [Streptomyces sp. NPDC055140]